MKNTITVPMSALYEKAWNKLVNDSSDWKKREIISDPHGRVANEAAHEAARLAEEWEELGIPQDKPQDNDPCPDGPLYDDDNCPF